MRVRGPLLVIVAACGTTSTPATDAPVRGSASLSWVATGAAQPISWQSLPADIEITKITFDYDLAQGGQVDYTLAVYRVDATLPYPSLPGGYGDLVTLHPTFFAAPAHWHQELDLTATPLFIPANTQLACVSSGGSDAPTQGLRSCVVEYQTHLPGDPRFRIFRIPYFDVMRLGGSFVTSEYTAAAAHALEVKSVMMYEGVLGTYTGCVQHLDHVGGVAIEEHCLPTTTKDLQTNVGTVGVEPLDWTVTGSEAIAASCAMTTTELWDCAFYLIVEIPPDTLVGAENSFRDYGNVPRPGIDDWCAMFVRDLAIPGQRDLLCYAYDLAHNITPGTACTMAEIAQTCTDSFAPAACMADDTCFSPPR